MPGGYQQMGDNMASVSNWTKEEINILIEKWEYGLTTREMMVFLPGRTRNMIIGMAHRLQAKGLKIEKRPDPIKRKHPPLPVDKIVEPEPEIIVEKSERYCAEPGCSVLKYKGSYCAHHASIYYKAPKTKDEEPQEFHSGYEKARGNF